MDRPQLEWAEVTIDCRDTKRVAEFWAALLDAPVRPHDDGRYQLGPMVRGGPVINIQPVPEEKIGKARVHLDIWVDDLATAIALVEGLGGTHTGEVHTNPEGVWVVMIDPEGTEFCLVALPVENTDRRG
jgi:predicted enzyme related to lactoylglutathione lyase